MLFSGRIDSFGTRLVTSIHASGIGRVLRMVDLSYEAWSQHELKIDFDFL